jgi:hypothetical protein
LWSLLVRRLLRDAVVAVAAAAVAAAAVAVAAAAAAAVVAVVTVGVTVETQGLHTAEECLQQVDKRRGRSVSLVHCTERDPKERSEV